MEPSELSEILASSWQALSAATWLQSLISGMAGAAIGSLATQWVISRHQNLGTAKAELIATKQAINLCFVILNQYLAFKRQMVVPMVKNFEALDKNTRAALASTITGQVVFDTDFRTFSKVMAPVNHLDLLMLGKVNMGGRGLAAALQINSVSQALADAVELRNQMVSKFQGAEMDGRDLADVYLGLETKRGSDTRFKDNIRAISLYTDDTIFFAHTTLHELRKHGERLIQKNRRRLGSKRDLGSFEFKEGAEYLLPAKENYVDWLNGFKEHAPWWKLWDKS